MNTNQAINSISAYQHTVSEDKIEKAKNELSHYAEFGFRPHQKEAIEFILNSEKKYIFLEAPTGSGKSLIAMASGVASNGVTYSVHSKILQNQITLDFPEAKSLFGRSNYPCMDKPGLTCEDCYHTKATPCNLKWNCKYEKAKREVLGSRLRILNYDYLLTETNHVGKFSESEFNIVDEADNLENSLINFIALNFTNYSLGRLGMADHIERLHKTSKDPEKLLESWKEFVTIAKNRAVSVRAKLDQDIDHFPEIINPDQEKKIREKTKVNRLISNMDLFLNNVDPTWLYDNSTKDVHTFRPLWLTEELANKYLWRHSKKWCLMSASFLPIHLEAKRLGIPLDEVDYKILPSTFPPERRPIHVWPVANLTGKTMDEETPKLVKSIREIVDSHSNVKGLIHGVSYKLSTAIYNGLNSPRILIHDSSNRQDTLDRFMTSDEPLVLISPSMERGVSLEMDLCRFIIVAKAPFLYLGDKIVAARVYGSKLGNAWYAATMLSTVLQMTGRGMRSADDECVSYILDEQFQRVFQSKPKFLPDWWKEAVEW